MIVIYLSYLIMKIMERYKINMSGLLSNQIDNSHAAKYYSEKLLNKITDLESEGKNYIEIVRELTFVSTFTFQKITVNVYRPDNLPSILISDLFILFPNLNQGLILDFLNRNISDFINIYEMLSVSSEIADKHLLLTAGHIMSFAGYLSANFSDNGNVFNSLYSAVAVRIGFVSSGGESTLVGIFKRDLALILPGAKIISVKNSQKHAPDLWLSINNKNVPVEAKLHKFNEAAKKQLLRYMDFYKCDQGIAIAQTIDCDLPDNITFYSIALDEER